MITSEVEILDTARREDGGGELTSSRSWSSSEELVDEGAEDTVEDGRRGDGTTRVRRWARPA